MFEDQVLPFIKILLKFQLFLRFSTELLLHTFTDFNYFGLKMFSSFRRFERSLLVLLTFILFKIHLHFIEILGIFKANFNSFSSYQSNFFYIVSARDIIQILNGSQDIQLLRNVSAFSNIKPILKYDCFKT